MPAGTKTFLRQKITLASSEKTSTSNEVHGNDVSVADNQSGDVQTVRSKDQQIQQVEIERDARNIGSRSVHSSPWKINESSSRNGVLRYALHLRFVCPHAKKSSKSVQRCKTHSFAAPARNGACGDGERRFYLCSDLKVVFPQRHSDADEGKICFELETFKFEKELNQTSSRDPSRLTRCYWRATVFIGANKN